MRVAKQLAKLELKQAKYLNKCCKDKGAKLEESEIQEGLEEAILHSLLTTEEECERALNRRESGSSEDDLSHSSSYDLPCLGDDIDNTRKVSQSTGWSYCRFS